MCMMGGPAMGHMGTPNGGGQQTGHFAGGMGGMLLPMAFMGMQQHQNQMMMQQMMASLMGGGGGEQQTAPFGALQSNPQFTPGNKATNNSFGWAINRPA